MRHDKVTHGQARRLKVIVRSAHRDGAAFVGYCGTIECEGSRGVSKDIAHAPNPMKVVAIITGNES
jgi:hypothetical protein